MRENMDQNNSEYGPFLRSVALENRRFFEDYIQEQEIA